MSRGRAGVVCIIKLPLAMDQPRAFLLCFKVGFRRQFEDFRYILLKHVNNVNVAAVLLDKYLAKAYNDVE